MPHSGRHVALYAGSFDPITLGHLDVLQRARRMFDAIVLAIGNNPDKLALFGFEERLVMTRQLVKELLADHPEGAPVEVLHYTGLTVDFAREMGACALLRGIRNVSDLDRECQLAITNRTVANIETIFLVTGEQYAFTSSSLIRQIAALGGELDRLRPLVPQVVVERLKVMQRDPDQPLAHLARDAFVD